MLQRLVILPFEMFLFYVGKFALSLEISSNFFLLLDVLLILLLTVFCLHCKWIVLGLDSRNVSGNGTDISNSNSKHSPTTPRSEGEILQSSNLRSFTLSELRSATRNFHRDSVVGEGGFGSVFKGWVDEHTLAASMPGTGIVIAVKNLDQEGWQGHREWLVSISFVLFEITPQLELNFFKRRRLYCEIIVL